jgi:DNA-binding NtrC family response regulator
VKPVRARNWSRAASTPEPARQADADFRQLRGDPETLIESELFGYEKGAFTGANTNRMGLIEAADGGTLFLDEIGELPMEAQARLLRFIQEGEIRRIGSVQSRKVDVRLICATHRDLQTLAAEGAFRQDLYYRINVLRLELPPLRERGKDILFLAERLLDEQTKRWAARKMSLSPRAIQAITTYQWPGNVRELEHAIERAVILTEGAEIDNEALGIDLELVNINRLRGDRPERQPSARRALRRPGRGSVPGRLLPALRDRAPGLHERDGTGAEAGYQPQVPVGAPPALRHTASLRVAKTHRECATNSATTNAAIGNTPIRNRTIRNETPA